eukprot:gene3324-3827_t
MAARVTAKAQQPCTVWVRGDSNPPGIRQSPPHGFTPTTNDTLPTPCKMGGNGTVVYFLFIIKEDPTETENLACSETAKMSDMLKFYANYSSTAVVGLSWKYGFRDPAASHTYGGCAGPYEG